MSSVSFSTSYPPQSWQTQAQIHIIIQTDEDFNYSNIKAKTSTLEAVDDVLFNLLSVVHFALPKTKLGSSSIGYL